MDNNFSLKLLNEKIKKSESEQKREHERVKYNAKRIIGGSILLVIGIPIVFYGVYLVFAKDVVLLPMLLFFLGLPLLMIGYILFKDIISQPLHVPSDSEIEKLKNEYDALISRAQNGKWEPEYNKLSELCNESSITTTDDAFSYEKFKSLVEKLLIEDGIPETTFKIYKSKEKLKLFFNGVQKSNQKKADEHERMISTPVSVNLTKEAETYYSDLQKYRKILGKEKRIQILTDTIKKVDRQISNIRSGEFAARELGFAIRQASVERKTSNWGISGGIASAIAGPAAGIAAAYDTMTKNAEIERENAKNRAYAHALSNSIYSSSFKMSDDRYALEKQKESLEKELERAKTLVVVENISSDKILKTISIGTPKIDIDKDTSELLIEVEMNSSFIPDKAFAGKMVVDGYIEYDIYKKDIFVGKTTLLFPLYGINCEGREAVPVNGKCDKCLPETTKYELKNPCGKLWLVEA